MRISVAAVSFRLERARSLASFHERLTAFSDAAAQAGADFLLFPECFTAPLLPLAREKTAVARIREVARRFTAKTLAHLQGLARRNQQVILSGTQPVLRRGALYHVSYVVPPRGEATAQAKIHLTRTERRAWKMTPGTHVVPFRLRGLSFGVTVCYDVEFPEIARMLVDAGASTLFVPYCTEDRAGHLRVRTCAAARAVENQIYVVCAGTVGGVPGVRQVVRSYGSAAVLCPSDKEMPRDGIVAEGEMNKEELVTGVLDLETLRRVRRHGDVTPHLDRRVPILSDRPERAEPAPPASRPRRRTRRS